MTAANPISQVQAIVGGILGLVLLLALAFGVWKVNDWRTRAQEGEAAVAGLEATAQATAATTGAYSDAQADTQRVEVVVTQGRAAAVQAYEEARREDPTVRDFADLPVPARLRQLACERRQARDRSAGAAAGSAGADRAPDTCGQYAAP